MICGRVQNRLSAYLDQELGGAEMIQIQRHLSQCAGCRGEREALEQVRRLLGGLSLVEPLPGSQERAFRELAAVAEGRPRQRAARGAAPGWSAELLRKIGTGQFTMRGAAWAGAACLGLVAGLAVTTLRQPQHPDAVVAMIRPEMELAPAAGDQLPPLTDYASWQRAGGHVDWPGNNLALLGRAETPAYRLIGLENE